MTALRQSYPTVQIKNLRPAGSFSAITCPHCEGCNCYDHDSINPFDPIRCMDCNKPFTLQVATKIQFCRVCGDSYSAHSAQPCFSCAVGLK